MSDAAHLRTAIQRLSRAFGLLRDDVTPCGVDLPIVQAHALMALLDDADPAGLRVSDLHAQLQLDMSNVSRLGARMEHAGLVVRGVCPDDARAVRLVLTPVGRELAKRVDRRSRARFERLLGAIDPADRATIVGAVDTLAAAIQKTQVPED